MNAKGIAHWDLNFDNILIEKDTQSAKVTDLGFSKCYLNEKLISDIGTFYYAAPEIFMSGIDGTPYTEKCDVWSVGVILY